MKATPEINSDGTMAPPVPIAGDGGFFLRCRTYDGTRSDPVDVFIPADQVDQLLLLCRDQARENRRRSGPSTDARSPLLEPDRGRRPPSPPVDHAATVADRFARGAVDADVRNFSKKFRFDVDPNAPSVADILGED